VILATTPICSIFTFHLFFQASPYGRLTNETVFDLRFLKRAPGDFDLNAIRPDLGFQLANATTASRGGAQLSDRPRFDQLPARPSRERQPMRDDEQPVRDAESSIPWNAVER
jgi:hypothetical protein